MKLKHVALVLITGSILLFGCKKLKDLLTFDMSYSKEFTIPGSIAGADFNATIPNPEISTNSTSTFDAKKTASNLVKTITLKEMKLQITAPTDSSYYFLELVEVYISANGVAETKIASKTNIPASPGGTITLDPSGANLMDYLKKDKFSIRVRIKMDQTTTITYTNKASMIFEVSADPL